MDSICSVKSLSEYIAVIEDNQLFNYISRGENRFYETPLSSGIQRRKLRNYQELLNSFHLEVESAIDPLQERNFLAFAQHHGMPTNLLDFSTSPLVSLYFSIDGCRNKGYVYFINKTKLININAMIYKRNPGWGLMDDLFCFNPDFFRITYPQMSDSFIKNRKVILDFFEKHAEQFIQEYKHHRATAYLNTIVGVSEFEKALEKYKYDRQEWIAAGKCADDITLQIKDSVPNFLNGLEKAYKDDIFYPSLFIKKYTEMSHLHIEKTRFAANIDVILFLLEMEKIEHINNFWRSHTENYKGYYYEMEFPFYFAYQPPVIDERVKNQSSLFVFQAFSSNISPRNEALEQVWQKILPDFVIEVDNPILIRNELDYLGINSKHIYCDYDHIAQYITSQL